MSSSRRITDFLVAVGVATTIVVCAGLVVKNILFEAEPRVIFCAQFGTGATGKAEKIRGHEVSVKINPADAALSDEWTTSSYAKFDCPGVFGSGWYDVPQNQD